jgi:DNA (cytosine-5)-methyltransferase 1
MAQSNSLISLFSGIGGLDEGLHQAGFRTRFCCELDDYARASLKNWADFRKVTPEIGVDILQVCPSTLRTKLGLGKGELDLLAGGPPCQSFSLIGKRESLADPRGQLLFQMVRFAEEFRPKLVLIEQVKGLRSAPDTNGERGGVLISFETEFINLGYSVQHKVLRASDYGVPQHRDRLFIVAAAPGYSFSFPTPSHIDPKKVMPLLEMMESRPEHIDVRKAIGDLPSPVKKGETPSIPNHIDVTPRRDRERIHGVPEGKFLAAQLHLPASQRLRLNPKKDTTKFRRLSWNKPSLTLRGGEAFYHPAADRYITPREALRIHGFPDELVLEGPIRGRSGTYRGLDQHRQVANAVPPALAAALGRQLVDCLERECVFLQSDNRDGSVAQQ